jgi:signal peptidase II
MRLFKRCQQAILFKTQCALLLLIAFDLWTKHLAVIYLPQHSLHMVPGWLSFQLAFNQGTAFSFLSQSGAFWHTCLLITNGLTILGLLIWLFYQRRQSTYLSTSLILLIAGGCGNFLNRWLHQYVVDFISLSINGHGLFICNVADVYVTFGLLLLMYDQYLKHE